MKEAIATKNAPAAIGPYSQAIKTESLIFCSGQLPIDPATGKMKTTVLLADMSLFGEMNEVYGETFSQPYPGRSAFAVKALPMGALVEIEVIATRN